MPAIVAHFVRGDNVPIRISAAISQANDMLARCLSWSAHHQPEHWLVHRLMAPEAKAMLLRE